MTAPLYELRKRKEAGAPYIRHSIVVSGVEIHAQISPYTEDEIEQRIGQHLHPAAVRAFNPKGPKIKPGPKKGQKRTASVNDRGFLWKDEE